MPLRPISDANPGVMVEEARAKAAAAASPDLSFVQCMHEYLMHDLVRLYSSAEIAEQWGLREIAVILRLQKKVWASQAGHEPRAAARPQEPGLVLAARPWEP